MRFLAVLFFISFSAWTQLRINPGTVMLQPGQTQQFSTTLPVTWTLSGPGVICPSGLYIAPSSVPATAVATLIGTSITQPGGTKQNIATAIILATGSVVPGTPSASCPTATAVPAGAVSFIVQEIPSGAASQKAYGTGYVLTVRCPIAPNSLHLWSGGLLYYEGENFFTGPTDPTGNASMLAPNQIAALNFEMGQIDGIGAWGKCGNGPCPAFRADYKSADPNCK